MFGRELFTNCSRRARQLLGADLAFSEDAEASVIFAAGTRSPIGGTESITFGALHEPNPNLDMQLLRISDPGAEAVEQLGARKRRGLIG